MNKLLGTALVASTLSIATHVAFADEQVRESRNVDAKVTKVRLEGVVSLVVHQGATPALVISGDKDAVGRVITSQRGNTLEIDTEKRKGVNFGWHNEKLRAELTVPNLEEFVSHGVGSSTITGFTGDKLTLTLDGAGSATVTGRYRDVNASLGGAGSLTMDTGTSDRVEVRLGGAGSMTLTGQAKSLYGKLGGVGSLTASELRADAVDLQLTGIGSAKVFAKNSATVNLSGIGSATVYGNPASRHANSSGLGKVHWN
jgi:hypothetical protein